MDNPTIDLFILAIRSHLDGKASVRYFVNEEEAKNALDSIDISAQAWLDIKYGKAVFDIPTDDIDFWRDSKKDSWFRAELDKVKWFRV
jgi:hypothetical protein